MSKPLTQGKWRLPMTAALLWVLAAASVVYWGSSIAGHGAAVAAPAAPSPVAADDAPARQAAVARMLGASPPAAAGPPTGAARRFALLGVIASAAGKGAALISVDGEPALSWPVGARIASDYVLEAVTPREALLIDGARLPSRIILSLPAPEAAIASAQPSAGVGIAASAEPPPVMGATLPAESSVTSATTAPSREPGAVRGPPPRRDSRYHSPA